MEGLPDKGICDAWWHPQWISFASDGGGNSLCLDLAPNTPTTAGKIGQIITMNHEDARRELLANGFAEWLADLAETITAEPTD